MAGKLDHVEEGKICRAVVTEGGERYGFPIIVFKNDVIRLSPNSLQATPAPQWLKKEVLESFGKEYKESEHASIKKAIKGS